MSADTAAQAPAGSRGLADPVRIRRLVLAAGLVVLALFGAVMVVRRVDNVEVAAALLFMPVFIAAFLWRVPGGVAAGAAAGLAYAALRYPAIQAMGADHFAGLILARAAGYLLFGAATGWSLRTVGTSLDKLESYDRIDDETGLYNARYLVQEVGLETSRSTRYHTIFSVVVLDIEAAALEPLTRRRRTTALRDIGRVLNDAVRSVDRVVHAFDGTHHRFALVLPETDADGAGILSGRLRDGFITALESKGAQPRPDQTRLQALTFPGDDEAVVELRQEFAAIARAEYPETGSAP